MSERISLLEPGVEKKEKSHILAFTVGAVIIALAVIVWVTFRYYPEKKAATEFFDALVAGENHKAHAPWEPTGSYKMGGFFAGWGPTGSLGPAKNRKILCAP